MNSFFLSFFSFVLPQEETKRSGQTRECRRHLFVFNCVGESPSSISARFMNFLLLFLSHS